MTNALNDVSLEYFEEYRRKKQQELQMSESLSDAHELVHKLTREINDVKTEISNMQKIIATMIDHGVDPVEAKMRIDELASVDLWAHNKEYGSVVTLDYHINTWNDSYSPVPLTLSDNIKTHHIADNHIVTHNTHKKAKK
jgi:hypothetical protein